MPLAPAATLLKRFPDHLAQALVAQDVPQTFIAEELAQMPAARLAPTANRSVLGIMNEFTFMAESTRSDSMDFDPTNLTALAGWLAGTPCSPLFKRHTSPDRELRELVKQTCHRP
jgi:phosphoketolase